MWKAAIDVALRLALLATAGTVGLRSAPAPAARQGRTGAAFEPASWLGGRRGCVLVADLATGERFGKCSGDGARREHLPGSVFKVASAVAIARGGNPPREFCPGIYDDRGRRSFCVLHSGHGSVGLDEALAASCNFYFRKNAPEREALLREGLALGLLRPAALPALRRAPVADLVLGMAPGQEIAPEDLLESAALWPRNARAWRLLRRGLVGCVASGTCRAAGLEGVPVAGKTGTAPAPDGSGATQAWFVGLAPAQSPRAAVVVFLERGEGREAAAYGGGALRWYFRRPRR